MPRCVVRVGGFEGNQHEQAKQTDHCLSHRQVEDQFVVKAAHTPGFGEHLVQDRADWLPGFS